MYFEVARVPWSQTDKIGASVHLKAQTVPNDGVGLATQGQPTGGHLLVVHGDPRALMSRCTHILFQGAEQLLTEAMRDTALSTADAMIETEEQAGLMAPVTMGFAHRRLPQDEFLPGCEMTAKASGKAAGREIAQREIQYDEINFPLDKLTYLGHFCISGISECEPATAATLAAAEKYVRQQATQLVSSATRDREERERLQAEETKRLVHEAKDKRIQEVAAARARALAADTRATEAAELKRVATEVFTRAAAMAESASAKAAEVAATAASAEEIATVSDSAFSLV